MISWDAIEPGVQAELADHLRDVFVESGCTGTLDHTELFLAPRGLGDAIVELEMEGGVCDCAVLRVIDFGPDHEQRLEADPSRSGWCIPRSFAPAPGAVYRQLLRAGRTRLNHCYAKEGEILLPALVLAIPSRRIDPRRHFFLGIDSGEPSEYGVVSLEPAPIVVEELVARARACEGLEFFGEREAHFTLSRLAPRAPGQTVGCRALRTVSAEDGAVYELSLHHAVKVNLET